MRGTTCRVIAVAIVIAACGEQTVAPPAPDAGEHVATTTQGLVTSDSNHTFAAGSWIIPMDTSLQDNGIFLAYGLVYQLLKAHVPVSWVIKPGKRLSTATATDAAGTATFTTTQPHGLAVGDRLVAIQCSVNGYNGARTVLSTPTPTTFTATVASGLGAASGCWIEPSDFTVTAVDHITNVLYTNNAYRGGPFVIDSSDVGPASGVVNSWLTAHPSVAVHVTTAPFTGFVKRELVAAPSIAMFADGNETIAEAYVNAAGIPDSQGNAWAASSPDLLTPDEVAGPSCTATATASINVTGTTESGTTATFTTASAHGYKAGYVIKVTGATPAGYNGQWVIASVPTTTTFTVTMPVSGLGNGTNGKAANTCQGTPHDDGMLFDANHVPAYCQMMSMHWNKDCQETSPGCASSVQDDEVVREYRRFLNFPTHLFTECQAANAVENNTNTAITLTSASETGTTATFTTPSHHAYAVGDTVAVAGMSVAGYNGKWVITATPSLTTFQATLPTSGLGPATGGTAASYNGLFLTTTGYSIGTQPSNVDSFNFDLPFTQLDGPFNTTGGSEPAYSIPVGGSYKGTDSVMLTERGTTVGVNDVWMTGYLDGKCNLTSEFCDPSFAQGKVSVLGGHNYGTSLPESSGASQGTRLFLNALFEAPCATDNGAAALEVYKTGPAATSGNQATFTILVNNPTSSVAGSVVLRDFLVNNVSFVSATGGGTYDANTKTVTWNLGNMGPGSSTAVTLTVQFATPAVYINQAIASFKAGVTPLTANSNIEQTCYYGSDPSICASSCDANAPACANGCDDDGDGKIDFPDDPGCDAATDPDETDTAQNCSNIKGRVLLVMDTSGSLEWNTCSDGTFTNGDGSFDCPGDDVACSTCGTTGCGNGVPDDSRIEKVKLGISNAVNGFGEVEWGMMRFKQIPVGFACGTANVNRSSGGWQGASGSPCTGFSSADVVVKFDPSNQNDLLTWIDGRTNYPTAPPAGKDFELRASGNTPLAGSLASAKTYLDQSRGGDCPAVSSCRPYNVVLVTDGGETCAGDPVSAAAALRADGANVYVIGFSTPDPTIQSQLNAIASAGGTGTFVPADDEVQLSAALQQIVQSTILTEKCNGLDDDCDGRVDEDWPNNGQACSNGKHGICAANGTFVCTADQLGVVCNAGPGQPPQTSCPTGKTCSPDGTETCANNLDDDCDGFVDEGCASCVPTAELCNGRDDDCDGATDEDIGTRQCGFGACSPNAACCGTQTCVNGNFTACSATPPSGELCNNVDDDCDGVVDEDLATACSNIVTPGGPASDNPGDASHNPIPQNICHPGIEQCTLGTYGACTDEQTPQPEICDGLDNDCDNIIDEDTGGGSCNAGCGVGVVTCAGSPAAPACCQQGSCNPGEHECGTLYCSAQGATTDATCDGVDDDCDGRVDEDWQCGDPGSTPSEPCACSDPAICNGQNKCVNGSVQCAGQPLDPASCCDCGGQPMSPDPCPGGSMCAADCTCAYQCAPGEFPCPSGKKCVNNYCVVDPCVVDGVPVDCPSMNGNAQVCVDNGNGTHSCVDACSTMQCPSPLICYGPTGECKPNDCTTFPEMCTASQHCVVDTNTGLGSCVSDPCAGVTCPSDQYCEAGTCHASCAGVTCPSGQRCVLGTCQADPCGGPCPDGQACNDMNGHCESDPCQFKQCPQGDWCNPGDGQCEPDPCLGVTCPGMGQVCIGGTCNTPAAGSGSGAFVTVGGGGCSTTGDGSLGLVLLVLVGIRRRRS